MAWFQRVNPTIVSGHPETTGNVATPPKCGPIHGEDRSLAARRTARGVVWAIWVCGNPPYRTRALEREESLRDVGFDEWYAACFSDESEELEDAADTRDPLVRVQ